MADTYDLGNVGTAKIFEGAASGLSDAVKNLYNIQVAKATLNQKLAQQAADTKLKSAAADKMEAEGQISGLQADQMREFIKSNKKVMDAQGDLANQTIDTVEDRVHKAARGYHGMLSDALQTPQGQAYARAKMSGSQDGAQSTDGENPVVNAIMPGVGSNQPENPPMSVANPGNTGASPIYQQPDPNAPVTAPQTKPVQTSNQAPVTDVNQGNENNLPPLSDVYKGLSNKPFGDDQNDLYMKNPNVMEAVKTGNYLVKKDASLLQAQNPLLLNENDRTVLNDVQDLKKMGYSQDDIFNQLTPGTKTLIDTIGKYQISPDKLTSQMGGGRQRQELTKAVKSFYPNWSEQVYDQRHKALVDFTDPNGKNGQAIASMRQGIEHMGELMDSIDAVKDKTVPGPWGRNVPVLNMPADKLRQYVGGDPDILALKQNINAVTEEMTKAWGGSQAGEGRLKNWRETMASTNSPQGWSGLLSKTAKLWQAAADTRESMFSLAMGGQKMEDVLGQKVLEPNQQQILDRVKNGYTPPGGQNQNNTKPSFSASEYEAEMRRRGLIK